MQLYQKATCRYYFYHISCRRGWGSCEGLSNGVTESWWSSIGSIGMKHFHWSTTKPRRKMWSIKERRSSHRWLLFKWSPSWSMWFFIIRRIKGLLELHLWERYTAACVHTCIVTWACISDKSQVPNVTTNMWHFYITGALIQHFANFFKKLSNSITTF